MKSCTSGPGIAKLAGITPTTRNGPALEVDGAPHHRGIAAEAPPPEAVGEHDHRDPAPTGAAALLNRPAAVSSRVKVRPTAAATPRSGKKSSVTCAVSTTSDSEPTVSVRPIV